MITKYFDLLTLFLGVDFKVYNKYRARLFFSFFQIFTIVFLFYFISQTVGEIPLLKTKYFPFVASGLAFQFLFTGIVNAANEKLREYRDYGVLEEILFSKYPPWLLFLSVGFQSILIAVSKSLLLVLCIGYVFKLSISLPILVFSFLALVILAMSLSFVGTCSFLVWKRFSLLELGGSLFTLFLTGIYFPIQILPQPLQLIAELNPLKHGLEIFRYSLGMSQGSVILNSIFTSFLSVGGFIVILFICNVLLYRFTLKKIKKLGVASYF